MGGLFSGYIGVASKQSLWGAAQARLPCSSPGVAKKVEGREAQRQCGSCVLKRKPVALHQPPPPPKYLSPSMARAEQLLGVAEKTLLECQ